MFIDIVKFVVVLAVMTALVPFMGTWLAKTFTGAWHFLPERWTYRLFGIDPDVESGWKGYALALVLSNAAMMLVGYALLRFQGWLPLNPLALPAQDPGLAFNTAASFITNTNWQSYRGETLSNFSQMAVITFLMTVSAATGIAACAAFIRGLGRKSANTIGNFWVDITRVIYRVLLPIGFLLALVYVWQGTPQTLNTRVIATTLDGTRQAIRVGPVASLETIKLIGTNGGGFFAMNSAHPYENPTPLTNVLGILSMLLIPSALTYAFGTMLRRRRQGWVFFSAFMVLFITSLAIMYSAEQYGNPLLTAVGVDSSLPGNMVGKEVRFGIGGSSLFAVTTTSATTGAVNTMHDALTPLGGAVTLWGMMLNTVFGGDGVGFINLIAYAILAVFLVGMMIGRSPELFGKKIEAREIKLTMLAVLAHPFTLLGFTALAVLWPGTADNLLNPGPHGFSEYLYAYSSGAANNGSCFCGLSANTPFFNTTIGLAMLFGRYLTLLPMLAVAGSLAAKQSVPASAGTLNTATPTFAVVLVAVIVIVGGLTFFPALALGPIAEHFQMLAGVTL